MASGHMNRVKRPDTWLHRPRLQNVKKVLANPEPSTHDPQRSFTGFSNAEMLRSPGLIRSSPRLIIAAGAESAFTIALRSIRREPHGG